MKINSFSFRNNSQNLHIEEIYLENLNLLVGGSGVGKTTILSEIYLICSFAQGKIPLLEDVEWSINFSHLGQDYRWEIKTSAIDDSFTNEQEYVEILDEKLSKLDANHKIEILHRTKIESKLDGKDLPKLKMTESAISLLAEEESIIPVAEGFKRLIFSETLHLQNVDVVTGIDPHNISIVLDTELKNSDYSTHLQKFKENSIDTPPVITAYYLQENFSDVFEDIKEAYTAIFPSVEDIRVTVNPKTKDKYSLILEILEKGSKKWIPQSLISSGMYITLTYLIEISSAPSGSIFVVDEFENSLGINCMPQLTELILDKSPDLQFILTSHHPYIINNIPWKTWQLVSRTNGTIRSRKAVDIPTLNTASSLDKFTQLINLFEYEDEIA